MIAMMNSQSYYGFSYPEEILRVSKNKSICLKALIQNLYIQMQMRSSDGEYHQDFRAM